MYPKTSRARRASLSSILLTAAAMTALNAGPVLAQDGASARASVALDEIVVTARSSSERLQETPVSVVTVSGAELTSKGVESLGAFARYIPNLAVGGTTGNGGSVASFTILGIGGGNGFHTAGLDFTDRMDSPGLCS